MRSKTIISTIAITTLAITSITPGIASAHSGSNNSSSDTAQCLDGSKSSSYVTSFTRGTGTITTKDSKAICEATDLVLESFTLPDTWDGKGFNNTAIPQTKFAVTKLTMPANQANFSKTVNVEVPNGCKSSQLDFYFTEGYDKIVGLHDDDGRYINGVIFKGHDSCITPTTPTKPVETPKPTTPTPSTPATPTEVKKPQVVTPAPVTPTVTTPATAVKPATLPNTGVGDLLIPFSVATMIGTAVAFAKQRFNR
jgi:hypothetical protein